MDGSGRGTSFFVENAFRVPKIILVQKIGTPSSLRPPCCSKSQEQPSTWVDFRGDRERTRGLSKHAVPRVFESGLLFPALPESSVHF